jgi:hypothetical protein
MNSSGFLPVIYKILEEEFVRVNKIESCFCADEAEQPLLVRVPAKWVVHFKLEFKLFVKQ